jgi:type I restriction enzyme S subunit
MNNNMKIIPELRFPEFQDDEEWDDIPLNDLCTLITKGTTPTTVGYSYTDSGVNFIKIESILEGEINLEKAAFISLECNEALKRSQLKENDILISIAGALGVVTTVRNKILPANTNQALSIVRLDNELQRDYVKSFLKSNQISSEISKIKAGAAQPNISLSQVSNFRILIPLNPQEQQKIASCLSSLDELIAAHSQKLDLLKDHKKGLMQNLFPNPSSGSGGESVPKYRFPEFENDGDRVEKKLGEVAHFLKGKGISKSDIVENGKLPCVRYGELYTYYNETVDIIKSYTNKNVTELVLSEAGDVIIPASGETQIDIATASSVLRSGVALGGDLNIIRSKLNGVFLAYYLNSAKKEDIAKLAQGISVVHLYSSQLQTLHISFPRNPKEQQKIASCLSAADELITAQAERIAQLQQHKKGLMQGLFPKMEG